MATKTSDDFRVGDVVICLCPENFFSSTAKFLTGREGLVVKAFPAEAPDHYYCGHVNRVFVKWSKRNGRGKEKEMLMRPQEIEIVRRGEGDEVVSK